MSGEDAFGIRFDFFPRIADVRLDPDSGPPCSNMPGVLYMDTRRHVPDDANRRHIFFGAFDDGIVPEEGAVQEPRTEG
jgi:hypothetical protein